MRHGLVWERGGGKVWCKNKRNRGRGGEERKVYSHQISHILDLHVIAQFHEYREQTESNTVVDIPASYYCSDVHDAY